MTTRKTRSPVSTPIRIFSVLVIVAILSLTPLSPAKAADWSNDKFSCNLEVLEIGALWEPTLWGVWTKVAVYYYLIGSEDTMSTKYICYRDRREWDYKCARGSGYNEFSSRFNAKSSLAAELKVGISKNEACEKIFKEARITWSTP